MQQKGSSLDARQLIVVTDVSVTASLCIVLFTDNPAQQSEHEQTHACPFAVAAMCQAVLLLSMQHLGCKHASALHVTACTVSAAVW